MDVDWNAEVVDQLESHWQQRLRPRLDGLTDAEYFWPPTPGCWTLSRRGRSSASTSLGAGEFTWDYDEQPHHPEPVTTIAWRLAHLIVVFASTNGAHFGRPPASPSTFRYAGTAGEALQQLDDQYEIWISGVRSLGTDGLAQPQGYPPAFAHAPVAKKMLYVNVEVIHHGAEICLLRDLYLRNGSDAVEGGTRRPCETGPSGAEVRAGVGTQPLSRDIVRSTVATMRTITTAPQPIAWTMLRRLAGA